MKNLITVTESIAKRVERAEYRFSARHGRCIICGAFWNSCPHDFEQQQDVISAVKLAKMLGLELPK